MSFEVVHTSVARGLRGESGFATAILTRGLPAGLESGLQDVSGYDHDHVRAVGVDTVEWAHRIVTVRGRPYTVLSRIGPNGVDASRRPNRIAHHLVLEPHERAPGGPAWILGQFGAFETGTPEVAERAAPPQLPAGDLAVRPANAWNAAGFDPGWAGVIAQTLLDAPQSTVYVVMPDSLDVLPLVIDVLALLPAERRWHVTFSTRPLVMLPHVRCQLRFVRAEAPGLARMLAEPGVRVVRVEHDADAGDSDAAIAARRGALVEPSYRPANTKVHPVLGNTSTTNRTADSTADRTETRGDDARDETSLTFSSAAAVDTESAFAQPATSARAASAAERGHRSHARGANDGARDGAHGGAIEGGRDAMGAFESRERVQWPPFAIALVIYSGLASLGALILFFLAALDR